MEKLFREILLDSEWKPKKNIDYSNINIIELKKMADKRFDNLNLKGDFFYDYNDVLERIELLKKMIDINDKSKSDKSKDE